MVLTDVGSTTTAEERQTSSANSVGQERLFSARPDLIVGDKIRPVDFNVKNLLQPYKRRFRYFSRSIDVLPYTGTQLPVMWRS